MSIVLKLSQSDCTQRGKVALAPFSGGAPFSPIRVFAVPRGGVCALIGLMSDVSFPFQLRPVAHPHAADVILDDIIDSGKTRQHYTEYKDSKGRPIPFVALVDKQGADKNLPWIQFPWESENGPEDGVLRLIEAVGEDPKREGLLETPKRVVKAFREMTAGYKEDPKEILSRVFEDDCDEIVAVRGISFVSLCEHHLLPFSGVASVGYLPKIDDKGRGHVVGLSKLARLVDCFARRFQMQERLTRQIATTLFTTLEARGAGVVIRASHSCMGCRGVKKPGAEMITSVCLGQFRTDEKTRAEFMSLLQAG